MKKTLILSIFLIGTGIGAIASEIAENALYLFKAGDPILASEVNANFDTLLQRIESLEERLATYEEENLPDSIVGTWSCADNRGRSGFLVFDESGRFSETGVDVFNGIGSGWQFATGNTYILTGNGTNSVEVTFTNSDSNMHLVPEAAINEVDCVRA